MDQSTLQVSTFPPPPEFSRHYTNDNVSCGRVLPPPPPIQGHYSVFGQENNTEEEILTSLASQKIQQVYSIGCDPRQELKRLVRSLVVGFLDLVELLIRCPDSNERQEKLEHLRLLFINTHHLVNEYRPHQARETVHLMLQLQKQERLAITDRFETHFDTARNSLRQCLRNLPVDLRLNAELIALIENVQSAIAEKDTADDEKYENDSFSDENKDRFMCGITDL